MFEAGVAFSSLSFWVSMLVFGGGYIYQFSEILFNPFSAARERLNDEVTLGGGRFHNLGGMSFVAKFIQVRYTPQNQQMTKQKRS